MGKIKKIIENDLVGGTTSTDVYPITSTKAVYNTNNECIDDTIKRRLINISTEYNNDHVVETLTINQALAKVPSEDRVPGFRGEVKTADGWVRLIFSNINWYFTEAQWLNTNNWIIKNLEDSSLSTDEVNTLIDNKLNTLSSVAKSGDYNDLNNKPTIPTSTSNLLNDSNFTTKDYVDESIANASLGGGSVDLSSYATKTYLAEELAKSANFKSLTFKKVKKDFLGATITTQLAEFNPASSNLILNLNYDNVGLELNRVHINSTASQTSDIIDIAVSSYAGKGAKEIYWFIPTVSGTEGQVLTSGGTDKEPVWKTIYAPTTLGNDGEVLTSTSSGLVWKALGSTTGKYLPLNGGTVDGNLYVNPSYNFYANQILSYNSNPLHIGHLSIPNVGSSGKAQINIYPEYIYFGNVQAASPTSGVSYYFDGSALSINGTWQTSSDMTRKNKIEDIIPSFNDVIGMPLFSFTWKNSNGEINPMYGTSAQYWKEKFPIAVRGDEGSYSVAYGELALACTKSAAIKINELETEVQALKNELAELKSTVAALISTTSA